MLLLLFVGIAIMGNAQKSNATLDKLMTLLPRAKDDSATVVLYQEIGYQHVLLGQTAAAQYYYKKGISLSEKIHQEDLYFNLVYRYSQILHRNGKLDSALLLRQQLFLREQEQKNENLSSHACIYLAQSYTDLGKYELASDYYLKALTYFEQKDKKQVVGYIFDQMSLLYNNACNFEKAIEYGEKAIAMFVDFPEHYSTALVNLGNAYERSAIDLNRAVFLFKEAIKTTKTHPDIYVEGLAYLYLGNTYMLLYQSNDAKKSYEKALTYLMNTTYYFGIAEALRGLSILAMFQNNLQEAKKLAQQALEYAEKSGLPTAIGYCMKTMGDVALLEQNMKETYRWRMASDSVFTVINSDNLRNISEDLHVKYETEKKDIQIESMKKNKQLTVMIMVAVGMVLIMGVLALLFIWLYTRKKRRKAELQVQQLEQQKQLIAMQSVLDGETQERIRIARDLHDVLGSMLTGVKLNLNELKQDIIFENRDVNRFNDVIILLDAVIHEMRQMSRNMMPESLSRLGLKSALTDLSSTFAIIKFNWYGEETRLNPRIEMTLYCIVNELINNALKHSSATRILLQIVQDEESIMLTVQDNGIGFDAKKESTGTGLKNVRARINACNGEMDMVSYLEHGTEINIKIPLNK